MNERENPAVYRREGGPTFQGQAENRDSRPREHNPADAAIFGTFIYSRARDMTHLGLARTCAYYNTYSETYSVLFSLVRPEIFIAKL